ncbi:MAG: hypothetical protein U9R27_02030 [Campylobacterota bacterium]|nr:hypothetical protein [Campylobacterota bacterium]
MTLKRYQNELILSIVVILMILSYLYKNSAANSLDSAKAETTASAAQIGKIIVLKEQWGDPKLSQSIKKLKQNIAPSKIKQFSIKGKKLAASFQNLSDKEMNGVILKIKNIAVRIVILSVKRSDKGYQMEIKCKW